ncbi:hypothetical protein [Actinoplanes sp. NPDC051494]|uniref:hypothetical protein n=1 Tax=Actinoplanes sp. NPDC051494 TaxID=3363907 RepID=UPI0037942DDA
MSRAISTYPEPCWTLVRADGRPVGPDDAEPHFDTEAQALAAVASWHDEDRPDPTPKRLTGLCSIATAACGYIYDEDDNGQQHWQDAQELHAHLLTVDWSDLPNGEMRCSADSGACEECDGLIPPLANAVIPGQLDLLAVGSAPKAAEPDHDCGPTCPSPCPQDDDDPRGWQG